jgi:hypothetical protein
MTWVIKRTETFLESFAQVRTNKKVLAELGKNGPFLSKRI